MNMPINKLATLAAEAHALVLQDKAEVTLNITCLADSPEKAQQALRALFEKVQKSAKKRELAVQASRRAFQDEMELKGKQQAYEKTGKTIGSLSATVIAYDLEALDAFLSELADKKLAIVGSSQTSISSKLRKQMEDKITTEALEAFGARAKLIAKSLNFKGYDIHQIDISQATDEGQRHYAMPMRSMAMSASSGGGAERDDTQGYVSAREERLSVAVSGSIVLR